MTGLESVIGKEGITGKARDHCKVVLLENGKADVRRVHTMLVQAANGMLYEIEGNELPEVIIVHTGMKQKGRHVGQILLNPNQHHALDWLVPTSWLSLRAVGIFMFGMLVAHLLWTVNHAVELEQIRYTNHP